MTQLLGGTHYFSVFYEDSVTDEPRAQALLATVDRDFVELKRWFGLGSAFGPHDRISIDMGRVSNVNGAADNGGYQQGFSEIEIKSLSGYPADQLDDMARYLFVAEAAEILMSYRNQHEQRTTWDPAASNGEGLSQVAAELLYPQVVPQLALGGPGTWLNSNRPDWVTRNDPTDLHLTSFGCAVLFIYYLHTQCGYPIDAIVQAGGPTLAETFTKLSGQQDGYAQFTALLNRYFPPPDPGTILLSPRFRIGENPFPLLGPTQRRLGLTVATDTVEQSDPFNPGTTTGQETTRAGGLCPAKTYQFTIYNSVVRLTAKVTDHHGFGVPAYSWVLNGVPLPPTQTLDDIPLSVTATVRPDGPAGPGPMQVTLSYNAEPELLSVFNTGHPGSIVLNVELHAVEQWIPGDDTTLRTATGTLDTRQKVYEDAYYTDARNCRQQLNNTIKGLAQLNPVWQILPDPPPELLGGVELIQYLAEQINSLAKTDPQLAKQLDEAFTNTFGVKLGALQRLDEVGGT